MPATPGVGAAAAARQRLHGFRAKTCIADPSGLLEQLPRGVNHKPVLFEHHGRRNRSDAGKRTWGLLPLAKDADDKTSMGDLIRDATVAARAR